MTYSIPDPPSNSQEGSGVWEKWKQEVAKLKAPRSYKIDFPTSGAIGTYTICQIPTKYLATQLTNISTQPSLTRLEISLAGTYTTNLHFEINLNGSPLFTTNSSPLITVAGTDSWSSKLDIYFGRTTVGGVEGNYAIKYNFTTFTHAGSRLISVSAGEYGSPVLFDPNVAFTPVQFFVKELTTNLKSGHIVTHPAS